MFSFILGAAVGITAYMEFINPNHVPTSYKEVVETCESSNGRWVWEVEDSRKPMNEQTAIVGYCELRGLQ